MLMKISYPYYSYIYIGFLTIDFAIFIYFMNIFFVDATNQENPLTFKEVWNTECKAAQDASQ